MPFKFHASRRHHIPRAKYRVMNWPDYDRGLGRRGDIRFWIDKSARGMGDHTIAAPCTKAPMIIAAWVLSICGGGGDCTDRRGNDLKPGGIQYGPLRPI